MLDPPYSGKATVASALAAILLVVDLAKDPAGREIYNIQDRLESYPTALTMSNQPKLAIAGASARAAAHSALRGGYRVAAFDQFADADLAARCSVTKFTQYDHHLIELVQRSNADAWLYTGGIENQPELIHALSQRVPLMGCDAPVLDKVRDPHWLAASLQAGGYAYPEVSTHPPLSSNDLWLVKRFRSGGGLGVSRFDGRPSNEHAPGEQYYQRQIEGGPISGMYLAAANECHLLGAFEQLIGSPWTGAAGEFIFCGALGPIALEEAILAPLRQIGQRLCNSAGLRGLFGIDFMLSSQQVTLLEVNPRYTSSMELWERASGESAVDLHCRACLGATVNPPARLEQWLFAKAIVYAEKPLTVGEEFYRAIQWNHEPVGDTTEAVVADVPVLGQQIAPGEPICTVFSSGDDRETTLLGLKSAAGKIRSFIELNRIIA